MHSSAEACSYAHKQSVFACNLWLYSILTDCYSSQKTAAPDMVGKKLDGFTHVCDWYATWCALAGVEKDDTRAAAANANGANPKLPAVDGLDLWPCLLRGTLVHT